MISSDLNTIQNILHETRSYEPPTNFAEHANVNLTHLQGLRELATKDNAGFWATQAKELSWFQPWRTVLEWEPPFAKWFIGAKTNISYNCLDRIVEGGAGDKRAIVWEGEPGDTVQLSYKELLAKVCQCASALRSIGLKTGDRVVIYLPLIPEAVIAMLACARMGLVHSVVFGGFSAEAIKDRVNDAKARVIITADGGYRKGKTVALKDNIDQAFTAGMSSVEKVLVVKRTGQSIAWNTDRDVWWNDLVQTQPNICEAVALDSEAPLFTLYTSGTTGKPKGILHTTGGYMVHANYTTRTIFDLKPTDIYWCTADVGWITGHTYVVYGPLLNGATVFLYEGSPDCPDRSRFWNMIERYKVTILYTAPTAIRTFMKWGEEFIKKHDLTSLRLLGTVGEPINPEAWIWYQREIGGNRCPIVDTWWQTETGGIMIAPVPGAIATKPGSATLPLPGIDAAVVDRSGKECAPDVGGFLVIRKPWPSMLRTIFNDDERYQATYWSDFPGWYFTGDGARRDKDGYFWVMGRVDDVINVSGHRLGTAEVESALVAHPSVAEAAVVGAPDEIKGEAIYCFVTFKAGCQNPETLDAELKNHVVQMIGALARPERIIPISSLPKTRSGKIMRRLLRSIASGKELKGDMTTLEDLGALEALKEKFADAE